MEAEKRILSEIERYRKINNYIFEQEEGGETSDMELDLDLGDDTTTPEGGGSDTSAEEVPEPVDADSDPDVEVVGDEGEEMTDTEGGDTEELDVTELVSSQKDISEKQDEYMETMFGKLDDLTAKLSDMDMILQKIDNLEQKVEKYREKSPQEKLQLRSLDSYPYNQKLSDFFMDKQDEFDKTGKNEYILTSDEVENYSEKDIKKSFDEPFEDEGMM